MNLLAQTAPYPPACDKQGPTQCTTGTGGAAAVATPVSGAHGGRGGASSGADGGGGGRVDDHRAQAAVEAVRLGDRCVLGHDV